MGLNQIDACIGCASDRRFGGGGRRALEGGVRRGQSPILVRQLCFLFISSAEHPRARHRFLTGLRNNLNDSPGR